MPPEGPDAPQSCHPFVASRAWARTSASGASATVASAARRRPRAARSARQPARQPPPQPFHRRGGEPAEQADGGHADEDPRSRGAGRSVPCGRPLWRARSPGLLQSGGVAEGAGTAALPRPGVGGGPGGEGQPPCAVADPDRLAGRGQRGAGDGARPLPGSCAGGCVRLACGGPYRRDPASGVAAVLRHLPSGGTRL